MRSLSQRLASRLRALDRHHTAAYLALAVVLLLALNLRYQVIETSLPYPQHIDETYLADNAANMLRTGDFNPHFFMYGGLPIYLTTAAMTYGYLDAASHLELKSTAEIGLVGYPYYQHPRIVRPARLLFALISVVGLGLLAFAARALSGLVAMVLAPAWLSLSWLYFEQSQAYLNVNIVGSALAWAVLCQTLHQLDRSAWLARVVLPGLLCGTVIACKYNFAAILLVPLLAILWYGGERRLQKAGALGALAATTFLLCAPYTLLDFGHFIDDLGKITYAYRQGMFGTAESATFSGHLWLCLKEMQGEFGLAGFVLVPLGAFTLARRDLRRAVLVAVFPIVLLLQMSSMPTHLMRNLTPFLPLWALLGAAGLVAVAESLAALAARRPSLASWPSTLWRGLSLAILLAVALVFVPWQAPRRWLATPLTSRQEATAWILANIPPSTPLLVARELGLHPKPLMDAGFELHELPLRSFSTLAFLKELADHPDGLIVLPRVVAYHWQPNFVAAGEQLLPQFDAFLAEILPVKEFGSQKVSICFDFPSGGDPQFVLGKPRRSAAELAAFRGGRLLMPEDFHGELTQMQSLGLAILAQRLVSSKVIDLPAGSYRVSIPASGSPAKGQFPVVRARFGELELGNFVAGEVAESATFEFTLASSTQAALTLELLNDDVERDESGAIVADRNVWLQGSFIENRPQEPGAGASQP